jgi:hypothetical protein
VVVRNLPISRFGVVVPYLIIAGVLALSLSLVRAKQANAILRLAVVNSTHAFVAGNPLPNSSVSLSGSAPVPLVSACTTGQPFLAIFSQRNCAACERLKALADSVAFARPMATVLSIEVYSGVMPPIDSSLARTKNHARSATMTFGEYAGIVRLNQVPAAIAGTSLCRIAAAGVGSVTSEAVVREMAAQQ